MTGQAVRRSGIRRVSLIALAAAAVGLLGAFYADGVRPNLIPKNFGVVDEGKVYRSGQLTPAAFASAVKGHGIRTVIDLGSALNDAGTADDDQLERLNQRSADALGVRRVRLSLLGDGTGDPNEYVRALRVMNDPAAQPVLVHCGAGSERTGAASILYMNLAHGVPIDEGYARAGDFRHDPKRNPELKPVLDQYGAAIVEAARDGTVIPYQGPGQR
ncbi:MAG: tyrosine-protein phosphatase [Phycisphaerales bacterium]|nr:tyrosine-protein phosphatase [Phycisphaerales bacterium]